MLDAINASTPSSRSTPLPKFSTCWTPSCVSRRTAQLTATATALVLAYRVCRRLVGWRREERLRLERRLASAVISRGMLYVLDLSRMLSYFLYETGVHRLLLITSVRIASDGAGRRNGVGVSRGPLVGGLAPVGRGTFALLSFGSDFARYVLCP